MPEFEIFYRVMDKLDKLGGNKLALLTSLMNKHSFLISKKDREQAAELFKEIYLLETIIIEDVLEHNGYVYNDNIGAYPVWYKKTYGRNF